MSSDEVLTRPSEPPDAVLRYADHPDGVIDLYLPPTLARPPAPSPLVVAVHGGFWRQAFDRTHLRPLAVALTGGGFAVALLEYRRVGGLGGWPQTGRDVEAALSACRDLVEEAAAGRVDPTAPVVLTGHSAGGHLALWAGLRAGQSVVRRIVALAPVSDLRYAARSGMGSGAVPDLLGGGPDDVPDAYAEADVLGLLPGDVPVTLIQGTDDKQVTVTMNRNLAARYRIDTEPGAAEGLQYVELPGVEHFALVDPLSPVFSSTVLPALSAS